MPDPRRLPNCPIVEALIDFRVNVGPGFSISQMDATLNPADLGYYVKGPIRIGKFELRMPAADDPAPPSVTQPIPDTRIGTRLHSNDEKFVAQFSVEGFTLSRLRPYDSWENLEQEARRLWAAYCEAARPEAITRVATRYINNLQLPAGQVIQFDDYLRCPPHFPEELPQNVVDFLQRVVVHDPKTQALVNIIQRLEPKPIDQTVPLILDIDAYRAIDFAPASDGPWAFLQTLRSVKNRVFFGMLTERTLELYA